MAAPGSMANGVLVFIPPNNTGILQQGQGVSGAISQTPQMVQYGPQQFRVMDPGNQPLGSTYSGSAGDQVAHLRKVGMMERFLKAQPKTLGAIQILTGLMHIGFSAVCAIFIGYYIPISFIGGYPFWGGFSFIISGSLSVAAEKHHKSCLVKGSLGMNITSAIFSAIGIILLLTELIINASFERHSWLGGAKGITAMLFLLTVLEFCIAVSTSHFASEALCYTPSDGKVIPVFTATTLTFIVSVFISMGMNFISLRQMEEHVVRALCCQCERGGSCSTNGFSTNGRSTPYSNVAYDPKEEIEHRAS